MRTVAFAVICWGLLIGGLSAQQRTLTFEGIAHQTVFPDKLIFQEFFLADGDKAEELQETISGYRNDIKNALESEEFAELKISFFAVDQGGTGNQQHANFNGFYIPFPGRAQNAGEQLSRQWVRIEVHGVNEKNFKAKCDLMRKMAGKIKDSEVPFGNPNQNRNQQNFKGFVLDQKLASQISEFSQWQKLAQKAFDDAKKKAEVMAKISGGTVGKIVSVSTGNVPSGNTRFGGIYPQPYPRPGQMSNFTDLSTSPVNRKDIYSRGLTSHQFSLRVQVTFEFVPDN